MILNKTPEKVQHRHQSTRTRHEQQDTFARQQIQTQNYSLKEHESGDEAVADLSSNIKQQLEELQAEEEYITLLKQQRHEIETLKSNYLDKEGDRERLLQENEKLKKYKPYYEEYNKLKQLFEQTLQKLEESNQENQALKQLVDRYEQDARAQQAQLQLSEEQRQKMLSERERLQKVHQEHEQTFNLYTQNCKRREQELLQRLQGAESIENMMKNEIKQQTLEKQRIEEMLSDMRRMKEQHDTLREENFSLLKRLRKQEEKISALNEQIVKLQKEKSRTRSELDRRLLDQQEQASQAEQLAIQNNQIKNLQTICQQLESLRHDDEKRYTIIHAELLLKEKDAARAKDLSTQLSQEYDAAVKKIQEFESELNEQRRENHELRRNIGLLIEKAQHEKSYRNEVEKIKSGLASVRSNEIERLNDCFENLQSQSQSKGFNMSYSPESRTPEKYNNK